MTRDERRRAWRSGRCSFVPRAGGDDPAAGVEHAPERRDRVRVGTSTPIDRQQERIERQRRIVEAFQQAFVPPPIPAIDGLRIDAAYFPADEEARVGGDWYDVLALADGSVLITMGDVTDHGLHAALSMAKVGQAIQAAALDSSDPADVLQRADRVFSLLGGGVIASAVVVFADRASRTLRYALAGHPPPVVAGPNGARFVPFGSVPLGAGLAGHPETAEIVLAADEVLVLYTDGLIEAHRTVFEDEARLLDAAQACARGTLDASGICQAVIGETRTPDDVAILTLRLV